MPTLLRLFLLLLLAPTLLAQTADLRIVSFNVDKTALQTGERFTVTMRWRNDGPDPVGNVQAEVGNGSGGFVLSGAGTSNWPCEPTVAAGYFTCRGVLAPGAEAEMVVTMRAPARIQTPKLPVVGSVFAANVSDPNSMNNSRAVEVPLTASARTADLSITNAPERAQVMPGANAPIALNVRNSGPDAAENVVVHIAFAPGLQIPVAASGNGWSCLNATHSPWLVLCSRPSLPAGFTAPIEVAATMPDREGSFFFAARVSGENSSDPNVENDAGITVVLVGDAADWEAILVPLLPAEVPGANGARWKTQTTMLINSDTRVDIHPVLCDFGVFHCGGEPFWPLRTPFDAGEIGLLGYAATRGGQFYYVRREDASKVWLNSRVWDLTREAETAGSEIPIVRERELVAGENAIVGIPVAPHYRHTLRVYDFAATHGGQVAIRLYADEETTPRANVVRTLAVSSDVRTTTADLPVFPGYLELDPATLANVSDAATIRVEIAPVTPELRLWSFVSVTNNTTHHVTTFSAQ